MRKRWSLILLSVIGLCVLLFALNEYGLLSLKSKEEKQAEVMTAIKNHDMKTLKQLVDHHYPLDFKTKEGDTPLQTALHDQNIEAARVLIDGGAKTTSVTYFDIVYSLNDYIQLKGSSDYKKTINTYVDLIKKVDKNDSKADVNVKADLGNTPLHVAAMKGDPIIIEQLVKLGAKPDIKNKLGATPFQLAIESGHLEAVQALYKDESQLAVVDKNGDTPIIIAAKTNRTDILKFLLTIDKKTMNLTNKDGKTALIIAAEYGSSDIVDILVKAGADRTIKSREGKTALDYAKEKNYPEILMKLK